MSVLVPRTRREAHARALTHAMAIYAVTGAAVRGLFWALACATILVTIGCSTPVDSQPSSLRVIGDGDFEGLVDIGGGRQMYLECRGTGSPTVVFISGRSDRGATWSTTDDPDSEDSVFSRIAQDTRACAYDRPGTVTITGEQVTATTSTPIPQPTTAAAGAADLQALISIAQIPGPIVLVAHSWGGLIAREHVATFPDGVAGLVLIDTVTELLYDDLTEEQRRWWLSLNSNYSPDLEPHHQEKTDFISSFETVRRFPSRAPLPAAVLVSDQPYDLTSQAVGGRLPNGAPADFGATVFAAHVRGQLELARRLRTTPVLDTDAGHYIHNEQPDLTVAAITTVIGAS